MMWERLGQPSSSQLLLILHYANIQVSAMVRFKVKVNQLNLVHRWKKKRKKNEFRTDETGKKKKKTSSDLHRGHDDDGNHSLSYI